jgi:quercetin dioxygenase-like cupin family protein
MGGWTAENPVKIATFSAPLASAEWSRGTREYLRYRDLKLGAASGGLMAAQHLKVVGAEAVQSDWHRHDSDFQFFYVLRGEITIEPEHGDEVTLTAHGVGYQPRGWLHRERISADYEAVEITSPAVVSTVTGINGDVAHGDNNVAHYRNEAESDWLVGAGPRSFLGYRDLDVDEPTKGRVHLHVLKLAEEPPAGGTGWHYHTMSQIFLPLEGSLEIGVEGDDQWISVGALDAFGVSSGPDARHNVRTFSADYLLLEMCVPAIYETIVAPAPAGYED